MHYRDYIKALEGLLEEACYEACKALAFFYSLIFQISCD